MTSTPVEKATKQISLPREAKLKPLPKSFFDDDDIDIGTDVCVDDDEIEILSDDGDDDKQVSDSSEEVNRINFSGFIQCCQIWLFVANLASFLGTFQ